jgi:NADH dehydrogenase FAD-containing subunit
LGYLANVLQDSKPALGVAPAVQQMGAHVVAKIICKIRDQPTKLFRYKYVGHLATIGHTAAAFEPAFDRYKKFLTNAGA